MEAKKPEAGEKEEEQKSHRRGVHRQVGRGKVDGLVVRLEKAVRRGAAVAAAVDQVIASSCDVDFVITAITAYPVTVPYPIPPYPVPMPQTQAAALPVGAAQAPVQPVPNVVVQTSGAASGCGGDCGGGCCCCCDGADGEGGDGGNEWLATAEEHGDITPQPPEEETAASEHGEEQMM